MLVPAGDSAESNLVSFPAFFSVHPGPVLAEVAKWSAISSMIPLSFGASGYPSSTAPATLSHAVIFSQLDDNVT